MAILTIPYDHARDPMSPDELAGQIAASLAIAAPKVDIDRASITVSGAGITPASQATIQGLISVYVRQPTNEQALRDKADQAIANLESADANWTTLTAAQKDAATRIAIRTAAKLARLALGRLEAN